MRTLCSSLKEEKNDRVFHNIELFHAFLLEQIIYENFRNEIISIECVLFYMNAKSHGDHHKHM